MADSINSTALGIIDSLDQKQFETIKVALKNMSIAHESYLLSVKVNDILFDLLETDDLTKDISCKLRTALRAPKDLLDSNYDEDDDGGGDNDNGIEEKESLAILGLSTNSTDMENCRLTVEEDSDLCIKVHNELLSWCSHAQSLEKILRQLGLTDYVDQPGDSLLNDNQCHTSRLRNDLCRLIEKRVTLSKEMQSLQNEDGVIINDTDEELKRGSTSAPSMTIEDVRTKAREIQIKVETLVASQDCDPVSALKELHRMFDEEIETKERTRKRLNAKLAAYKQLEDKTEFSSILKCYLKAKKAAVRWKWTLDELR